MRVRKWLPAILIVTGLIILFFILRNPILQFGFNRIKTKAAAKYHLNINAGNLSWSGFDHILVNNLCIQPIQQDTLAFVHLADIDISIPALFTGSIRLDGIKSDSIELTLYHEPERDNIHFLKGDSSQTTAGAAETNKMKRVLELKTKLFRLVNTRFDIASITLDYYDTMRSEHLLITNIKGDGKHISSTCIDKQMRDTLLLSGNILKKNEDYQFRIEHTGNTTCYIPFLDEEKGLKCRFKAISGEVKLSGNTPLSINCKTQFEDLHLNHWRLSKEDVVIKQAEFNGIFHLSENMAEQDSSSFLQLNNASYQLFAHYHDRPDTICALQLHMRETPSDTFFNSLPVGMFNTLKGISGTGTLAYDMQFQMDLNLPDSLIFQSTLKRKNFLVNHFGAVNYTTINEPFTYYAYSGEQLIREIRVGPENPAFTSLKQVSPYLVSCVLTSEDPSFMTHRGFVPESFRESIAQDYKERRFARGGSTITMQLVKNVFLNRNKTISRKIEEALIVYMIENLGLVSKDRMMEVYLNIIEWGPNVYGIGEASHFYFNKRPSELNLQECLFLAAIIPNPKYFRYQFDKEGHVKSYMADYFKLLSTRMVMRGVISERDTMQLVPDVKLIGPARQFVLPMDSIPGEQELELPGVE